MTVRFPPPHPYQLKVLESEAKFKVLACGRRFGKSHLAKNEALDRAINRGQDVWLVFPSYNNASVHWREILNVVRDKPFVTYRNQQLRRLEFAYRGKTGSLTIKSGDKPDNLRGAGLDFVVIDEAAFMQSDVWYEVVLPSLSDRNGDAMIISTPKGKSNWFYRLFQLGQKGGDPNWESWQLPTHKNPYVSRDFIKMAKQHMPSHKFRQEFLAEFMDNAGGAFPSLEDVCVLSPSPPEPEKTYVIGVDWARKNDFTVFSVFNRMTGEQQEIVRFNDIDYQTQLERLLRVIGKWRPRYVIVEENNMGQVLFESLRNDVRKNFPEIKVKPVYMTNPRKRQLVENFAMGIERKQVKLLAPETREGEAQYNEMSSFEMRRTKGGVEITYAAPRNTHDDTVMATLLAWSGVRLPKFTGLRKAFSAFENLFY